ncbi:MAG: DUF5518 domain-containing protein [Methanobacterium sp.]
MINWKAIVLGFIVTIVLAYLGNYIPYLDIPLAPIIGGIIAGLVVGGDYKNGIINGGLAAGIPGFIYTLIVIVYITGSTISTAVTKALAFTSYTGLSEIISVLIIIFGSIVAFGIYFILGLIGGIFGVIIKDKISENQPK